MDKKSEDLLLKTYAKKVGKTVEVLRSLLEKAKEEATETGFGDNDNIVKGRFRKKVSAMLYVERTGKTFTKREAYIFKGFLLGADSMRDTKDGMRRYALKQYEEDPEAAKLAGFVDEQGSPLDYRPTIKNRRGEETENTEYHKPIIGHKYVRDIFGIAKKEGDKVSKLFKITLWEGFASKFSYRPYTPIEFRCTIKSEGDYYILNAPRPPKGETAFKTITMDIDYQAWMDQALNDRGYSLEKLDEAVAATEKAIDPWVIVEGIVDYIDSNVNPKTGSRSITLVDVDSGMTETIRVFIPKDFPLAFREYSRVKVFGRPRKWKRAQDDDYSYSLNGISIYPVPGQVIESKFESKSAAGETDEEAWNLFEE